MGSEEKRWQHLKKLAEESTAKAQARMAEEKRNAEAKRKQCLAGADNDTFRPSCVKIPSPSTEAKTVVAPAFVQTNLPNTASGNLAQLKPEIMGAIQDSVGLVYSQKGSTNANPSLSTNSSLDVHDNISASENASTSNSFILKLNHNNPEVADTGTEGRRKGLREILRKKRVGLHQVASNENSIVDVPNKESGTPESVSESSATAGGAKTDTSKNSITGTGDCPPRDPVATEVERLDESEYCAEAVQDDEVSEISS